MNTLFIVHRPGKCPRVGYPVGDVTESLKQWVASNPDAEIIVLECSHDGFPTPGTGWVTSATEFLAIAEAP